MFYLGQNVANFYRFGSSLVNNGLQILIFLNY